MPIPRMVLYTEQKKLIDYRSFGTMADSTVNPLNTLVGSNSSSESWAT